MKILITEEQFNILSESICVDIKVGDTLMGGRFKNKKIVVKTIGKNDKGEVTINGKSLLRYRLMNEEKEYYDFWDEQSNSVFRVLRNFISDREKGITKKKWNLINPQQYHYALIEFMKYGKFMRFPSKYIDKWSNIVTMNSLDLIACTELFGASSSYPYDDFCSAFGFDENDEEYEKYYGKFDACYEHLESLGFEDWAVLPDGSDAMSDFGLKPLLKLIEELEEQETPEQKIVVINKILDVYHQRGDLCSAFIQGGSKSLNQISYNEEER